MMLPLSREMLSTITEAGARVRVGYPWWLRPWLMRDVIAITLGRRIYVSGAISQRSPAYVERLLKHELAHVRQVSTLGLARFLGRYAGEFARLYWRTRSLGTAYRQISFEVEARNAEQEGEGNGL